MSAEKGIDWSAVAAAGLQQEPPVWQCRLCEAKAATENGSPVATPGTFSGCVSLDCSVAAESGNFALRRRAVSDCPEFSATIKSQQRLRYAISLSQIDLGSIFTGFMDSSLAPWVAVDVDQWLRRRGVPAFISTSIAPLVGFCATPNGLVIILGSAVNVVVGLAAFFVAESIILIPGGVKVLRAFIADNPVHVVWVCMLFVAIAEGWVRLGRWFPRPFGLWEMGMGLGLTFFGFRDAIDDFSAFFALIGGLLTITDGRQRLSQMPVRRKKYRVTANA
jgi:hypothetical protein